MRVAGGTYRERCVIPNWDDIRGSGGRAALALSTVCDDLTLVTTGDIDTSDYVEAIAEEFRFGVEVEQIDEVPYFGYWTPLHRPLISPEPETYKSIALSAVDEVVLRFGMLEADVVVSAERAVYDPQTEQSPDDFFKNGSRADQVVLVCNEQELLALSGLGDTKTSVVELVKRYAGVVVKLGPAGAIVATEKEYARVPAFLTDSIFKIGSGDIFSAAIAFHWGEKQLGLVEAASLASRAVAVYVSTREAILDSEYLLSLDLRPAPPAKGKRVYLAAPFFDLGQRRVVEDTRDILRRFGHDVQSPLHEVGTGPSDIVAPADIALLRSCDMAFCILDGLDPGTVFETGFARALGLPVVAFAERTAPYEMTMFEGTGCQIFSDYTAAVYAVGWS